jgi:Rieske 2Fe-2S family protein
MSDRLCGIWGEPYIDLSEFVDTRCFPELDREISTGLCHVTPGYTGGSLKWMGVVAPWVASDPYRDYCHVIERFSAEEFRDFVALGDDPDEGRFNVEARHSYRFGDETDNPLSAKQMRYLKYRYGVYFPWQVCYHFLENERWEDKHSGRDKHFAEEAERLFPRSVAFIKSLPFTEIGRAVLFGLDANDHAPAHRDSEPGESLEIAQSISFAPRSGKRFYVCDPEDRERVVVDSPIYWFNDMDYHGVEPDPCFRYSIRVDGVFERGFRKRLEASRRL